MKLSDGLNIALTLLFLSITSVAKADDTTSWAGGYVGANLGVARYQPEFFDFEGNHNGTEDGDAVYLPLAGVQAGYNFQKDSLVYGIELDYIKANEEKSEGGAGLCGGSACGSHYAYTSKLDSLWSVRGRLGLVYDKALFYGTAGYGRIKADHAYYDSGQAPDSPDTIHADAFVAGMGVDYNISNQWSTRVEGLYYFAKKEHVSQWNEDYAVDPSTGLIRVGVNYKF